MKRATTPALAIALSFALAACQAEDRTGLPETATTGTEQSVQQTGSITATTTGDSGGSVSALEPAGKEFLVSAGMGSLYEVQAGNLALQKASHAEVKAFAQRMVTDHSAAAADLSALATAKGVALPTELAGEHKSALDHLSMLSGAEFDKAYMQHMVPDHQRDIAEFERAAGGSVDADLKAWAGKMLPTLRDHLRVAVEVGGKL